MDFCIKFFYESLGEQIVTVQPWDFVMACTRRPVPEANK